MGTVHVDGDAFFRRVKRIYDLWKECYDDKLKTPNHEMSDADVLMCAVGADEDVVYSKSTATQTWLFGYELSDTVLICAEQMITFLASKKKIEFLKQIEATDKPEGIPAIKLLTRDKGDNDKKNIEQIVDIIKKSRSGKKIGNIFKRFREVFWPFHGCIKGCN